MTIIPERKAAPMTRSTRRKKRPAFAVVTLCAALGLSACGSDGPVGSSPSATGEQSVAPSEGSNSGPNGGPSVGPNGGNGGPDLAAMRTCLEAAGVDLSHLPSAPPQGSGGRPSGVPSGMPTDMPTDMSRLPTDFPTDRPAGSAGMQLSDEARTALDACGISTSDTLQFSL